MGARKTVLVLRSCWNDMTAYGGFKWPEKGFVEAPDWRPSLECGGGLHGFLWGEGDSALAYHDRGAKWLVVRVAAKDVVNLGDKVKFPRGEVVFCGTRKKAVEYLLKHGGKGKAVMYAEVRERGAKNVVVGQYGKAVTGNSGTATAGHHGVAVAGRRGRAIVGGNGVACAGEGGIAVGGKDAVLRAGEGGTLVFKLPCYPGMRRLKVDGERVKADVFYEYDTWSDRPFRCRQKIKL